MAIITCEPQNITHPRGVRSVAEKCGDDTSCHYVAGLDASPRGVGDGDKAYVRTNVSGSAESPPLLEALAAKDGTTLRGAEWDSGFLSALRAGSLGFRAHLRATTASAAFCALGLAGLASLRLVFEALIGEEHLFAGSKNKFSAALRALQDSVMVFHEPLSPSPEPGSGWAEFA